jgi:hypothetical protein
VNGDGRKKVANKAKRSKKSKKQKRKKKGLPCGLYFAVQLSAQKQLVVSIYPTKGDDRNICC